MATPIVFHAEAITRCLRRVNSIADFVEYIAKERTDVLKGTEDLATVVVQSLRDALADEIPLCLSAAFCKERGVDA